MSIVLDALVRLPSSLSQVLELTKYFQHVSEMRAKRPGQFLPLKSISQCLFTKHHHSFYNDRDAGLGPDLTKLLIESNSPVPDFLEQYKPEGDGPLEFDDKSDDEVEDAAGDADGGGDGWGSAEAAEPASEETAAEGWGDAGNASVAAEPKTNGAAESQSGWGADASW